MTSLLRSGIAIAVLMFVATALAVVMTPTQKMADIWPKLDLERMIPRQFGDWRIDEMTHLVMPSPDTQAAIDKIYNQTLARTYVNSRGQRVMLSIAYGGDQSDAMQVHMPEGCYGGQGFAIKDKTKIVMEALFGGLPATRLVAYKSERNEPITYWIVVGDHVARNLWDMKLIKLRYATRGLIPEGLLFRLSSLSLSATDGYALQEQFVVALHAALPPDDRRRLFGKDALASRE